MIIYDGELVHAYADRLHRTAAGTVLMCAAGGLMTGASIGLVSGDLRTTALAAILVGIIGYIVGRARAFRLKLEAQLALCQVQIERNTRGSIGRAQSPT
jgi:hypothetical protein